MDLFHAALSARLDEAQERMAHRITRTGPVKVSGQHLSEAPNEPFEVQAARQALECAELREITEADWIAADLARNVNKGERLARANDAQARALDLQQLDAMRRVGAL